MRISLSHTRISLLLLNYYYTTTTHNIPTTTIPSPQPATTYTTTTHNNPFHTTRFHNPLPHTSLLHTTTRPLQPLPPKDSVPYNPFPTTHYHIHTTPPTNHSHSLTLTLQEVGVIRNCCYWALTRRPLYLLNHHTPPPPTPLHSHIVRTTLSSHPSFPFSCVVVVVFYYFTHTPTLTFHTSAFPHTRHNSLFTAYPITSRPVLTLEYARTHYKPPATCGVVYP